jgi:predicted dehydrogenase
MGATYDPIASAAAKAQGAKFDVEDFASAYILFRNGASLQLQASWAGNIKERELMETRLLGTKGGLDFVQTQLSKRLGTGVTVERASLALPPGKTGPSRKATWSRERHPKPRRSGKWRRTKRRNRMLPGRIAGGIS